MARKVSVEIVGDASSLERSFRSASKSTQNFERGLGRGARGAVAASVSFRGLGRSIAYASSAFVGVYGFTSAIRNSITEAENSVKAHASLAAALKQIGKTTDTALPSVNRWAQSQARFGVSANDAIKGLSRLVIITGSVSKAMRGYTAALEISKATGKSLQAVQLAVAKALNGQTTALARYIGKIPKGTSSQELLNMVMRKFGGQAAANTDAVDKFHAAIVNLETAVGGALHPTIEKIADQLTRWLENSRNQVRVQRDVTRAVHDLVAILKDAKGVIEGVDKVTGSFKHTLELLVGLKIASGIAGLAGSFGLLSSDATRASGAVALLRRRLLLLPTAITVAIGFEVLANKAAIDEKVTDFLRGHGLGFLTGTQVKLPANTTAAQLDDAIAKLTKLKGPNDLLVQQLEKIRDRLDAATSGARTFGDVAAEAAMKAAHGLALAANAASAVQTTTAAAHGIRYTATQRNTFFDNAIARILLRGGLGSLKQQLAALQRAAALISARIRVTKDITRKLNLEDQLLQIRAQAAGVRAQIRQAGQQAAQDRLTQISAREFFTLGLGPTGDARVPLKATLRKRLGTLSEAVKGTFLDTEKTRKQLAGIRKVLSESIVPSDVRAKIRDLLDQIRQELNQGLQGDQTRFKHISTEALLAGVTGLTRQQRQQLQARLAQYGAGGTVPGSRSAAFSGAGATDVIHTHVHLDGKKVGESVTKHQRKRATHRSDSRRGPYAGRN